MGIKPESNWLSFEQKSFKLKLPQAQDRHRDRDLGSLVNKDLSHAEREKNNKQNRVGLALDSKGQFKSLSACQFYKSRLGGRLVCKLTIND